MGELFLRAMAEGKAEEMRAEVARSLMAAEMRASRRRAVAEAPGRSVALFARLHRFFRPEAQSEERTRNSSPKEVCCV